jgi:hypothetical protein
MLTSLDKIRHKSINKSQNLSNHLRIETVKNCMNPNFRTLITQRNILFHYQNSYTQALVYYCSHNPILFSSLAIVSLLLACSIFLIPPSSLFSPEMATSMEDLIKSPVLDLLSCALLLVGGWAGRVRWVCVGGGVC